MPLSGIGEKALHDAVYAVTVQSYTPRGQMASGCLKKASRLIEVKTIENPLFGL